MSCSEERFYHKLVDVLHIILIIMARVQFMTQIEVSPLQIYFFLSENEMSRHSYLL